jgi:hypothetical protein
MMMMNVSREIVLWKIIPATPAMLTAEASGTKTSPESVHRALESA